MAKGRSGSDCRIFQRPSAGDQQAPFDPIRAVEAPVSAQPMVADRDAQAGDDVQEAKHDPIHPRVVIEVGIGGDSDEGAKGDEGEKDNGPITTRPGKGLNRYRGGSHSEGLRG